MDADRERCNVLIVDDVPDKLLALRTLLEDIGANVVTAEGGREALRHLLRDDFAVILLDVNMPDMDGFETATLIRQRRQTAHTPIIFVTGYGDELHATRGYSLGAVDYILTPVVPEILRTKVGVFVDLYKKNRQIERQADERVALAREQAARAAAEEATRRSEFLAGAAAALNADLGTDEAVAALLRLAVPRLAQLASVTLAEGPGRPWRCRLAWAAAGEPVYAELAEADAPQDGLRAAHDRVLETGLPVALDDLDVAYPPPGADPAPAGPPARLRSAVVLPLPARGRVLGALSLASPAGAPPIDRALAEDLAVRAAAALDNARLYEALRESDRRKDEFMAMLAHELRNPLAPICTSVELLKRVEPAPPALARAREVIDRQLRHVVRLVDDLLDVARVTRGTIQLRKEVTDLAAAAARAVELSRPLIDARGHDLAVTEPAGPVWVEGDPVRLAQVFANLLNNAAKYTDPGGRIGLSLRAAGGTAEVVVRDTGAGIPAAQLASVFEPFTQVDRTLDRAQGGLGIGLTLVKRLVQKHGGTVEARSDGPGRGSEFTVRLPLAPDGAAAAERNGDHPLPVEEPGACPPAAAARSAGRRVLLVDDNVDGAETLAVLLRAAGHEVAVSHDGRAGLAAAQSFRPEVVLLDIGLPGMDGYEVAARLRQDPSWRAGLLVALTGYGQAEDMRRAREAGFDHHFVKPIDPDALFGLLERPG